MKKSKYYIFLIAYLILFGACTKESVPKPEGYPRLEPEYAGYTLVDIYSMFSFLMSSQAEIEPVEQDSLRGIWFNIHYKDLQARVYCSYFTEEKKNFPLVEEDMNRFIFSHIERAEAMNVSEFHNPQDQVFGQIYRLQGNVPSPVQFVITDSIASFVKGSLYFDTPMNRDSLAPVINYIDQDIEILMESFRWKNR
jgi:hypothetical protein